jgi:hypothetical protein
VFERPLRALLLNFHFGFVYEANLDGQAEAECWNKPRYKPVAERACGFRWLSRLATQIAFVAPPGIGQSPTAHLISRFIL